jgi:ribonuclease-3
MTVSKKKSSTKTKYTISKYRQAELETLQKHLRIKFKNIKLLNRALSHKSYVNEIGSSAEDNERLEYLGDSVLALVVNEYLFKHYDKYPEGSLAKIKSAVVSETELSKVSKGLSLGKYILMGKGEEQSGGRDRQSILANTLEALIGAIYLDSNKISDARKFVLPLLINDIERIDSRNYLRDPKTSLQEYVQKMYKEKPEYELLEEKGPDHEKIFIVKLIINGAYINKGEGSSKRKAEMDAASKALKKFDETGLFS